jgi:hypothetical protein
MKNTVFFVVMRRGSWFLQEPLCITFQKTTFFIHWFLELFHYNVWALRLYNIELLDDCVSHEVEMAMACFKVLSHH